MSTATKPIRDALPQLEEPTMSEDQKTPVGAIKGFNRDMTCRGFQFAAGETYTHEGEVEACHRGFHAVTGNPIAVFGYYAPAESRFYRVELGGRMHSDDGEKTAAEIIKIGKEIETKDLVAEAVAWVTSRAKPIKSNHGKGDQSASSSTGYRSTSFADGKYAHASSTGEGGKVQAGEDDVSLFAREFDEDGVLVSVACGVSGRDGIKSGVWYSCVGGRLVEVTE